MQGRVDSKKAGLMGAFNGAVGQGNIGGVGPDVADDVAVAPVAAVGDDTVVEDVAAAVAVELDLAPVAGGGRSGAAVVVGVA
ncbi:MAG: hypothetical protein L0331_04795, partial [Chloroflexi bacterium]|nr:hypothetical protein [Chloroflexota bacterium]MCI0647184.1 hypothetical protein [Chloroflexota bacterium]